MIPRGNSDPAKFYLENFGFFWTYIFVLFLLFFYQFVRGVYLYWSRIRRDTDPAPEKGGFSPRVACIITSCVTIPIGLCFLILPIVELVKKTAYGGYAFGNHPMMSEPAAFWALIVVQTVIALFPMISGTLLFVFPPRNVDAVPEMQPSPEQQPAKPRMKTVTKVIIGSAAGVLLLGCLAVAAVIGGAVYVYKKVDTPEQAAKRKKATEDGLEFGKTTDQDGCMQKAFTLEVPQDVFDISNSSFIRSCLGASRKTENFCDGVPILFSRKWVEGECKASGHETRACDAAYIEKLDHCRLDESKPKS